MTPFHLATGEHIPTPSATAPKPQFHPVLGYERPMEDNHGG